MSTACSPRRAVRPLLVVTMCYVHSIPAVRRAPRPRPAPWVAGIAVAWLGSLLAVGGCAPAVTAGPDPASAPAAADTLEPLCRRIDAALARARDGRRLDASVQGAWQVVHGILAYGAELPLAHDGTVSPAVDHLLGGGGLRGWVLRPGEQGPRAVVEEGSTTGQGHPDQWLGYLAQAGRGGFPADTPLVVGGRRFTLASMLAQAQADIRPGQEATWTLMALAAWAPPDSAWTATDGSRWTTERVVSMEAEADLLAAACGGMHRLYGLAVALDAHRTATRRGDDALAGGWALARDRLATAIEVIQTYQQPDGSFSVHHLARPGRSADVTATLSATGHAFEVVARALPRERLTEPWVVRAAGRLVGLLDETADLDLECGALYHALHGLLVWRERVCGPGGRTPTDPAAPGPAAAND